MFGSARIGRIAGIAVNVSASWLIIFALLAASLALVTFPTAVPGLAGGAYWVAGIIGSILFFLSVLAHELAHSLVARARGLPVSGITLFIFGGVSNLEEEPRTAGGEFLISFVGPLTSLVLGGILWGIGVWIGPNAPLVAIELEYLGATNALLGVFNLIPGFPLDGGRVLQAIIWAVTGDGVLAMRWAVRVGKVVAMLFILWGILLFFVGAFLSGIWIGFIGWFLFTAAQSSSTTEVLDSVLRGVTVAEVMNTRPVTVHADLTVQELVDDYFLPSAIRSVIVTQLHQVVGLVTLRDANKWPRDEWAHVPVSYVMVPITRLHTVTPSEQLTEAIAVMAHNDVNQVPVVQEGSVMGILSRDAIVLYLETRRGMHPQEAERTVPTQLPRAS